MSLELAPGWFDPPPEPAVEDPDLARSVMAVHVLRGRLTDYAEADAAAQARYLRERRIRQFCERNVCDSWARHILHILDNPA